MRESEAAYQQKLDEMVAKEKEMMEEKSQLMMTKLKEAKEVETVDAQLDSGVDIKTSKALRLLRQKLQNKLAKTIRRLMELAAERQNNLEKIMNACKWVRHVPQVVFNGKAYASILDWATEQRLRMEQDEADAKLEDRNQQVSQYFNFSQAIGPEWIARTRTRTNVQIDV